MSIFSSLGNETASEGGNETTQAVQGQKTPAQKTAVAEETTNDRGVSEAPANANVRLAPSGKAKALPEGSCNIGKYTVEIPDEVSQEIGFHVEHPSVLVGQFPQYKFFHPKGDKNVPTITF